MKLLFIHPNFPGQFKYLARDFAADKNNQVVFACRYPNEIEIPGVKKIVYKPTQTEPDPHTHRYLHDFEKATYNAQALWRMAEILKQSGFMPDVIYAHPGWGEGMFLKDLFPKVPYIAYMEFFYHAFGADMHFDPKEPTNADRVARTRARNATHLINLYSCDWAISPTQWQASVHPREFHPKMSVIHEGIDTELVTPKPKAPLKISETLTLDENTEVVTYVARNFETYRGFPNVMYALEILLKKRPNVHALMVGADQVSYGPKPPGEKTFRQMMLEKVNIDPNRIHWLGKLPYDQYLRVLQQSDVHLYLTVPFVLSWSVLEAMASGCAIVASRTKPVQEVITHNHNGVLVDFFSPSQMAIEMEALLDNKRKAKKLGEAARQTIEEHHSYQKLSGIYQRLITDIAERRIPPSDAKLLYPKAGPYTFDWNQG